LTEALLSGSPTRDKGVATGAPADDERGFARPDGGIAELPNVGAFDFQDVTPSVSVMPTAASVALGGSATFNIVVTNASGNALPDDNTAITVTLSPGLTATSPLSFTLGPLAAGQSRTFTVTANATALGSQSATAAVTSPDAGPITVGNAGFISVFQPTPPPTVSLAVTVTPTAATVGLGASDTFVVAVTNTIAAPLPSDGSAVAVTFSSGLTPISTVAFLIGPLGAGQSVMFTLAATATALRSQTATATLTSSTPVSNTVTNSAGITVIPAGPTSQATTSVSITRVSDAYTPLSQIETVTAPVTLGGQPVTTDQVTIIDGGQSQTVNVNGDGRATAKLTFLLILLKKEPGAHAVIALYNGDTAFASSSTTVTASQTLLDFFFQLSFDLLILQDLGIV
jgi:hypothetical protein